MFTIKQINFNEICAIWRIDLWKDRKKIKPVSDMIYLGGYDSSIRVKYNPTFFACIIEDSIVGVNSCHKTSDYQMRSRGLWVNPNFRRRGITKHLFKECFKKAIEEGCKTMWSLPRKTSIKAYEASGFVIKSDWIKTETSDNNCYVEKQL